MLSVEGDGSGVVLKWSSREGRKYNVRSRIDPSVDLPSEWPIFGGHSDIDATPPLNILTIPGPLADPTRYFVIEEFIPPPDEVFSDDFEGGLGEWVISNTAPGVGPPTNWELGTPDGGLDGGPAAAASGVNCFGTNLADNTGNDVAISIVSPVVNLTGLAAATLEFSHFRDIEGQTFDYGEVRVLDADDGDALLVILETDIEGQVGWEVFSKALPPEVLDRRVKFEFHYLTDNFNGPPEPFAGWYIDDVLVTTP